MRIDHGHDCPGSGLDRAAALAQNGAWSDAALNAVLQSAQLEPRDAALAARICYGTLQNLTLLDHYLSAYCTTPLQKLEPKVLDLLRLSAYQIVLLDKVPRARR